MGNAFQRAHDSLYIIMYYIVTSSVALVSTSVALVPSSDALVLSTNSHIAHEIKGSGAGLP